MASEKTGTAVNAGRRCLRRLDRARPVVAAKEGGIASTSYTDTLRCQKPLTPCCDDAQSETSANSGPARHCLLVSVQSSLCPTQDAPSVPLQVPRPSPRPRFILAWVSGSDSIDRVLIHNGAVASDLP